MCLGCVKADPTPRWVILDTCGPLKLDKQNGANDYVIANIDRVGYFMVDYSNHLFEMVKNAITDEASFVSSNDVAGMLVESIRFSKSGRAKVSNFLDLCLSLGEMLSLAFALNTRWAVALFSRVILFICFSTGTRLDTLFSPWSVALPYLRSIRNLIEQEDSSCSDKLNSFVSSALLNPMLNAIVTGRIAYRTRNPFMNTSDNHSSFDLRSTGHDAFPRNATKSASSSFKGLSTRTLLSVIDSTDYDLGMLHELILLHAVYFKHEEAMQMGIALLTQGKLMRPDFRRGAYR